MTVPVPITVSVSVNEVGVGVGLGFGLGFGFVGIDELLPDPHDVHARRPKKHRTAYRWRRDKDRIFKSPTSPRFDVADGCRVCDSGAIRKLLFAHFRGMNLRAGSLNRCSNSIF